MSLKSRRTQQTRQQTIELLSLVWVELSNFTTQLLEAAVFRLGHMD